jgi:hypothetical protein
MGDIGNREYGRDTIADWKYARYQQSLAENPNFYFGPLGLILYGAASLTYALMPNGNRGYVADHETISSFYGAQDNPDGTISFNGGERIPANWTNRATPYGLAEAVPEILYMFAKHPVLVGGKTGPGTFNLVNFQAIKDGKITSAVGKESICLIYQIATGFPIPGLLNGLLAPVVGIVNFLSETLGLDMQNLGCPMPLLK